ncbi:phage/plasmid primase, P4 family [Sandarakinorhabdus sp.]|uniref:DNA primase family protein n=1 Tax=Sandarakinorhabdus sp. TaxID=1916663 RepID=UPI00286E881E|nr:phage/plasmid primase, P4 family [Sandarakinorhabdus sp.]
MTGEAFPLGSDMAVVDNGRLAWLEANDIGNAERLKARFGNRLAWLPHVQSWAFYEGRYWSVEDGPRQAMLAAQVTVRAIADEIDAMKALAERSQDWPEWMTAALLRARISTLAQWRIKAGNSNRLSGLLMQATAMMTVADEAFDADPLAINCRNGTLRLWREDGVPVMQLFDHDPADRLTKMARVDWNPKAVAPSWERHLATCLPSGDVRAFFQQAMGYCATGLTDEQCVFLLQGKGGDGKSTSMLVIMHVLGSYALTAGVNTFLTSGKVKDGGGPSSDVARLSGDLRLVSAGEPKKDAMIDDSRVKQFTGSGEMTARHLHKAEINFKPRGKLVFECNGRPKISGDDDGIWRRIVLILWPHQFDKSARVLGFEKQLMEEGPGVLAWLVRGIMAWMSAGKLVLPAEVESAVEEYRRSNSHFGNWLTDRTIKDEQALTPSKALYADYKDWCERNDIDERTMLTTTKFGLELGDRQFLTKKNSKGNIERRGVRLRVAADVLGDDDAMAAYDDMAAAYDDAF